MSSLENLNVKVERLPILVSGVGIDKLLCVPKLKRGTGAAVCKCIFDTITEWDLIDQLVAACFDTCSVNTGRINGVLNLLELHINKELLCCACRHHMRELLLKAAFEEVFGASNAPDVSLFKHFRAIWPSIDKTNYQCGFEPEIISPGTAEDVANFVRMMLSIEQVRCDYKELLELTLIILGKCETKSPRFEEPTEEPELTTIHLDGDLNKPLSFKKPGAVHHARWMAKAIYMLKLHLFRDQVILLESEREKLSSTSVSF